MLGCILTVYKGDTKKLRDREARETLSQEAHRDQHRSKWAAGLHPAKFGENEQVAPGKGGLYDV